MRSSFLILLGAVAGATLTLTTAQSGLLLDGARARAAAEDGARQLKLFRGVFERVRADYVEKPDVRVNLVARSSARSRLGATG